MRLLPIILLTSATALVIACDAADDTYAVIDTQNGDTTTTDSQSVEVEDAGANGGGGAGGGESQPKKKVSGKPPDPFRIGKCCDALVQNKPNASADQQPYYDLAINACNAAKSNPALLYKVKQLLPTAPPVCQ